MAAHASLVSRLFAHLPHGNTLPPAVWERRHRLMVRVMWAHVAGLAIFGLARGFAPVTVAVGVAPIALCAVIAKVPTLGHAARSTASTIGLLTASSVLTWFWGGVVEAHFHFFVIVALLATYEEWLPFVLAFAYVGLHHGVVGTVAPEMVFAHDDPWLWAAIHALFIGGLGLVCLMTWRLAEDERGGFRAAFLHAPTGALTVDGDGRIVAVNDTLCERTGYTAEELAGRPLTDLLIPEDRERGAWPRETERPIERQFQRRDGSVGWALWQHSRLDADRWVSHCLDITKRKQAEAELTWQAHHDPLTGLPNRTLFVEHLRGTLDRRRADPDAEGHVAVLFVDLDDFKVVNDSLGHHAGDRLLEAVAERLRRVLRPEDVIARFGGDEFTVLLANVADERAAVRVADRLAAALRSPILLDGEPRYVTASVGLSLAEEDDPHALLRDADAAMYRAKELGKARCEIFDASMRRAALERLELESALRHATARGELTLLYQPQVSLGDERVVGAEALLRWDHPVHGRIGPDRFIPLAEQTGLIVEMGAWVVREACARAATWPDDLTISVNVSARQLGAPGLADTVRSALDGSGLAPERLCLEITETALLADVDGVTETLTALKELGVRLAIDDFGVGHASLSHLRQLLPVDTLKIDKSFVDGIVEDAEDSAIVEGVVRLAHSLGLEVVAEGVETAAQAERLQTMACQSAQGFLFARPLAPDALGELLAAGRP
ncbi:MAG TPA: EAL domain-containing protein [Capillimicrobium sp.]|nr:EAL domain-containing protein [Capillimicrobium sp.]